MSTSKIGKISGVVKATALVIALVCAITTARALQVTPAASSTFPITISCGVTASITTDAPPTPVACTATQLTASISSGSCLLDLSSKTATPTGCGVVLTSGDVNLSPTSTFTGPPVGPSGGGVNPPGNVSASPVVSGAATISWQPASGGTPPYSYTLNVTGTPAPTLPAATTANSVTLGGLTGPNYTITVTVTDAQENTATSSPTISIPESTAGRTITIVNSSISEDPLTVYMGVNNGATGLTNLQNCYTMTPQPIYSFGQNGLPPQVAQFSVPKSTPLVIAFTPIVPTAENAAQVAACTNGSGSPVTGQISLAFAPDNIPWGPCPTSLAEFTLHGSKLDGITTSDTIDVSLVNGMNKLVNISGSTTGSIINMTGAQPPYNTIPGVYPPGCDVCSASVSPPTWVNCPGVVANTNCQAPYMQQAGNGNCQMPTAEAPTNQPIRNTAYTVTFSDP